MNVSSIFWQYVDMMGKTSFNDAKDIRLFQVFECCEILNRQLKMDQSSLVYVSQLTNYYKGVCFDNVEELYVFKSYKDLMYCTQKILQDCVSMHDNSKMKDKLDKLNKAINNIQKSYNVVEVAV
jgi:hypothetical protein